MRCDKRTVSINEANLGDLGEKFSWEMFVSKAIEFMVI
jgi:hypothetical protein